MIDVEIILSSSVTNYFLIEIVIFTLEVISFKITFMKTKNKITKHCIILLRTNIEDVD